MSLYYFLKLPVKFHEMNFENSKMYPGLPEYFDNEGRGLYAYLTGAASWYMLTIITEVFGVKGSFGDLVIEPKLVKEQFDDDGNAGVHLEFAGNTFGSAITMRRRKIMELIRSVRLLPCRN